MNFVDPYRGDLEVTDNDIVFVKKYLQAPTLLTGVVDEAYGTYAPATTYVVDDYVIITELNAIYKSSAIDNLGNYPPSNPNV